MYAEAYDQHCQMQSKHASRSAEMTTQTETPIVSKKNAGVIAGAMLILIGVLAFAAQFVDFNGALFLGGLGLIFLAWGLLTRNFGLLIPGGVLGGIAAGVYLIEGPYASVNDPAQGGIFLLAFAGGWVLISLLSIVTEGLKGWQVWPLIPAAVMAAISAGLMGGEPGLKALEYVGKGWPVILLVVGLYLILKRNDAR
jgi:protein-S-isoprenylcysteine O-methyltransferase Ste14